MGHHTWQYVKSLSLEYAAAYSSESIYVYGSLPYTYKIFHILVILVLHFCFELCML